ncbi:hypothetical protein GCM10007918_15190 [Piscinibacter gummiphilus]|nr:hypothetical protein GCM10007918_15190 [Piscinibacter gummiphilus]
MGGCAAEADVPRYDSPMYPPSIVLPLERPFAEFSAGPFDARAVLLAGLRWPTEYWVELALRWVEQGAPVDVDAAAELHSISSKQFSQRVRHRARAAAKRWTSGV